MKTRQHNEKTARTAYVLAQLQTKYRVRICEYDHTAIVVSGITEKQLSDLCRRLHCSGMYNDTGRFGIITNFGEYK
ncbi:hypothetical protein [Rikenella microfusus]|uniref:hypothetical protein n=1 Tax=Rikenella microfusus TaxID=28139 RepID=UPI00248F3E61|nr:hypothetical protein [Rikenella microfusus]